MILSVIFIAITIYSALSYFKIVELANTFSLLTFSLRFILPETLYIFWTCKTVSFPMLENFQLLSHQIFSPSPFSLFSSGKHIMRTLVCLILSQRSHRLSSTSFHSVFFIMFHKLTYPFFLPHLFYY